MYGCCGRRYTAQAIPITSLLKDSIIVFYDPSHGASSSFGQGRLDEINGSGQLLNLGHRAVPGIHARVETPALADV